MEVNTNNSINSSTKEKLLEATTKLLQNQESPERITARDIASAAQVNLAMINYHFKSKDELLYIAIGELMREEVNAWIAERRENISPYQRLRKMLISLCDITVKFSQFTSISIEYEIIKADITVPQYILPLIREIYGDKKSELDIRIIAYELISFLQLAYLRGDDFFKYAGVDILKHDDRVQVIDSLLSGHFCSDDA